MSDYFIPGQWSRSQTPDIVISSLPSSVTSTPLSSLVFASPTSSTLFQGRRWIPNISHEYSQSSTETELDDSRLLPIGTPSPTPSPSPSPISNKDPIPRGRLLSPRPLQRVNPLPLRGSRMSLPEIAIESCTEASWTLSSTSEFPPISTSGSHSVAQPLPDTSWTFSSTSSESQSPPSDSILEDMSATYLLHLEPPIISPLLASTTVTSVDAVDMNALQFATNVMSTWNSEYSGSRYLPTLHLDFEDASEQVRSSSSALLSNSPMSKKMLLEIRKITSKMKSIFASHKHAGSGSQPSENLLDNVEDDATCSVSEEAESIGRNNDQPPAPSRFHNRRRPSITPETYIPVLATGMAHHVSETVPPSVPRFSVQDHEISTISPSQDVTNTEIKAHSRPKTLSGFKSHKRRFSFAALSNITNRASPNDRPRSSSALLLRTAPFQPRQTDHKRNESKIRRTTPAISFPILPSARGPASSPLQDRHRSNNGPSESDLQRFMLPPLSEFASGLTSRGSWAHYRVDHNDT
ncbi:hypothetical protein D9758_000230 [Tetrapyrgos nigripes]|uniref:Uncharacterized protein n=1 Tax=Tetrapyrgos nigripes TaxID=182062 RepID=A0A8H5LZD7_9AGAR|nr:hypothetical protein D9758_000230 [Tetrapyrgos nigripes]